MRSHPEIGDTMVSPISFLTPVRAAIRSHHERWDGKGYPDEEGRGESRSLPGS